MILRPVALLLLVIACSVAGAAFDCSTCTAENRVCSGSACGDCLPNATLTSVGCVLATCTNCTALNRECNVSASAMCGGCNGGLSLACGGCAAGFLPMTHASSAIADCRAAPVIPDETQPYPLPGRNEGSAPVLIGSLVGGGLVLIACMALLYSIQKNRKNRYALMENDPDESTWNEEWGGDEYCDFDDDGEEREESEEREERGERAAGNGRSVRFSDYVDALGEA